MLGCGAASSAKETAWALTCARRSRAMAGLCRGSSTCRSCQSCAYSSEQKQSSSVAFAKGAQPAVPELRLKREVVRAIRAWW